MTQEHMMIYALLPGIKKTIFFKERDRVHDILQKIQRKENDNEYQYLFYDYAQIEHDDYFFDYYEPNEVYIVSKTEDIPYPLNFQRTEYKLEDEGKDSLQIDNSVKVKLMYSMAYTIKAGITSSLVFKKNNTVSEILNNIQRIEEDNEYKHIFFDGSEIYIDNFFFDFYDPSTVYIVSKSSKIPEEFQK